MLLDVDVDAGCIICIISAAGDPPGLVLLAEECLLLLLLPDGGGVEGDPMGVILDNDGVPLSL